MSIPSGSELLDALQADTKENLRRQVQSAHLMVMAIMDELGMKEIRVSRKTYLAASGGLETFGDFRLEDKHDAFVIRRTE